MGNIKFYIPKGQTIPLALQLDVDGTDVTYSKADGGFEFTVWHVDEEKSMRMMGEKAHKALNDYWSWIEGYLRGEEDE